MKNLKNVQGAKALTVKAQKEVVGGKLDGSMIGVACTLQRILQCQEAPSNHGEGPKYCCERLTGKCVIKRFPSQGSVC